MKGYILSVVGVILIAAAVSIVAPSGKMGKFVKGMTKLFILVILVAPFAGVIADKTEIGQTARVETDEKYLSAALAMMEEGDEREIAAWIEETYGAAAEVEVSRSSDGFSHEKIAVRVVDFGINGENTHIDILTEIREKLTKRYGNVVEVS